MKLRPRTLAGAPLAVMAIAALTLAGPAAVAAGAGPASNIRFGHGEFDGLMLGDHCIHGTAAASANVGLTWRSAGGTIKEKTSVLSSTGGGHWRYCAAVTTLVVGDSLKANDGASQRTFTIPLVTVKVDRVANEFRGRAPANSNLTLWSHVGRFSDFYERNEITSNAQGRWQYDDGYDIPGGADAYLDWVNDIGDSVTAFGVGPRVDVTVGSSDFTAYINPGQRIRIQLRDNATDAIKAIGTAVARDSSFVGGVFRDSAGHRVPVSVGDRVVALKVADDLNWNVPFIEATADVAEDTVDGYCHDADNPSNSVIVMVRRTGHVRGFAHEPVDSTGHFEVDFRDPGGFGNEANIKHGDKLLVQCLLPTGDTVAQLFLVP